MNKQEEIWDTVETHKSLFVLLPSLKAIFLFIVLGPPLGGVIFWISLLVSSEDIQQYSMENLTRSFGVLLLSLPFTYFAGGIQALVSGGAVAATLHRHFLINLTTVLLATTLFVLWVFYESSQFNDLLLLLPAHLISAAICLLVSRRYWGAPAK